MAAIYVTDMFQTTDKTIFQYGIDKRKLAKENKPSFGGDSFLSNREVSKLLKVSIRTLQEWRDTGIIPYIQIRGKVIYRQSDIDRLLQSCYNEERQE